MAVLTQDFTPEVLQIPLAIRRNSVNVISHNAPTCAVMEKVETDSSASLLQYKKTRQLTVISVQICFLL
jgi:hypothetical protein